MNNIRFYSTKLTHVDETGKARMVNVIDKYVTKRSATAQCIVDVGKEIHHLIKVNEMKKGDVLSIAQIAGILGAKQTSNLIPLCHNIPISSVKVTVELLEDDKVIIYATVKCLGQTGVEMEALTACAVAALTIYDMSKAISHDIVIKEIKLMEKSGGERFFKRE